MGFVFLDRLNKRFAQDFRLLAWVKKVSPVGFFVSGFTWDSLTLTRIDRLSDNLILFAYLILLGVCLALVNLVERRIITRGIVIRYQNWLPMAVQFFFGGLFSAYVVFYFTHASMTKTWLFTGLLVGLLIVNEFFEKRLNNFIPTTNVVFYREFFVFYLLYSGRHRRDERLHVCGQRSLCAVVDRDAAVLVSQNGHLKR